MALKGVTNICIYFAPRENSATTSNLSSVSHTNSLAEIMWALEMFKCNYFLKKVALLHMK